MTVSCFAVDDSIVRQTSEVNADGFSYVYELANGQFAEQAGTAEVVKGSYKYISPDGTPISVEYVADENGFQPTGDFVHPIPVLIAKSLEYLRTHAPVDKK